jgi:hypothetical protein
LNDAAHMRADIYNSDIYPPIDVEKGGSIDGVIDALIKLADMCATDYMSQGGTMIVPGHGWISDAADVGYCRDMMIVLRDRIQSIGTGPNPSDQGNVPYKVEGAQAAMKWDPAKDEAEGSLCKAYGAPGIMRQPTHLRITWEDDNTLKVEADFGSQTRVFRFCAPPRPGQMSYVSGRYVPGEDLKIDAPPGTKSSLQGYSAAAWTAMGGRGNFERGGSLKVVTTHLTPGYYWKNGLPYTGNAVLTEHFRVMQLPDGSAWLLLSQLVDDPEYLNQPFLVNYQFKKLSDGSKWNPTPCSAR